MNRNELLRCVSAYKRLLNISYYFVIGRKNKITEIKLTFSEREFFHLAGLQYLKDLPELNKDREKIFRKIQNDPYLPDKIVNSDNFSDISERVKFTSTLETFLDSNRTVFKFNNRTNSFSLIEADYILKNSDRSRNLYLFISKDKSGTYFCRSAFPRNKAEQDYTVGHTSYTLLYKEKINTADSTKKILYTNPSYTPPESRKPALCK